MLKQNKIRSWPDLPHLNGSFIQEMSDTKQLILLQSHDSTFAFFLSFSLKQGFPGFNQIRTQLETSDFIAFQSDNDFFVRLWNVKNLFEIITTQKRRFAMFKWQI